MDPTLTWSRPSAAQGPSCRLARTPWSVPAATMLRANPKERTEARSVPGWADQVAPASPLRQTPPLRAPASTWPGLKGLKARVSTPRPRSWRTCVQVRPASALR
jgi:hypothetical protein